MDQKTIEALGDSLYDALVARTPIAPLSAAHPDMTIEDAYHVQQRMIARRLEQGDRVIGKKIGVTSKAVQDMLGVFQPDFGFLTDKMLVNDGCTVSLDDTKLIQPRAEGEIAFMLQRDLVGPNVTREQVLDATAWVAPCFEIVDSRIRDWKIAIQDTVADNASCGVFVIGAQRTDPRSIDLAEAQMHMWRNAEPCGTGTGAAVQGHPAEAVAWLANTLGARGIAFRAGELILSGALSPLVPVAAGDRFTMQIEGLGGCMVSFVN